MLIGVDVGGTNLRVGVVDGLEVIQEWRVKTDFSLLCHNRPALAARLAIEQALGDAIAAAVAQYPAVSAVGLGFPGFVTADGRIAQSPNLPGLLDMDLAQPLSERLGIPVIVENDALAAAYGEYCLAGEAEHGLVYLGLGTGVGGGLIIGGKPYRGEHGVAMEIGHLIIVPGGRLCGCGNRGCLEQYASAHGVTLSYQEATGHHLAAHDIAKHAAHGDEAAIAAYALAASTLAQALAHILKVVDVSRVVIGGGMSAAWPLMAAAFLQRLEANLIPALRGRITLRLSAAGDRAGILGAARLAALWRLN